MSLRARVLEPFARNSHIDLSKSGWAKKISNLNFNDLKQADGLFAIVNGVPPDEGVMVDIGHAIALGQPIFLFRDDFRKCTECDQYPLNLMIFLGFHLIHGKFSIIFFLIRLIVKINPFING